MREALPQSSLAGPLAPTGHPGCAAQTYRWLWPPRRAVADSSDADRLLVMYANPQAKSWDEVLAIARLQPIEVVSAAVGRSVRRTRDVLSGQARPRQEMRVRLRAFADRTRQSVP